MEAPLLASGVARTVGVRRPSEGNLHEQEPPAGAVSAAPPAPHPCSDAAAILACLAACLGSLNFGTTLGYTSPCEPRIRADVLGGDEQLGALITSVVSLGALAGALGGGAVSAAFSRRVALALSAAPAALGWVLLALPRPAWGVQPALWALLIARVLCGIGVGMQSAVVPVYVAEVAPRRLRGLLGCCHQLNIAIGVSLVYALGWGIVAEAAECAACGWRLIALLCAVPNLLMVLALPLVPESPRWLVSAGRSADAAAALRRLRGAPLGDDGASTRAELEEVEAVLRHDAEAAHADDWSALFGRPMRLRLALSCGMQAGVQLVGINAVTFYAGDIFERAGLGDDADALATVQTLVGLAVTAISCALVDCVGRRPLLLASIGAMAPCLGGLVLYFSLGSAPGWLAVASLYSYVASFCIGVGALPWLIATEICPLRLRAKATAVATAVSWSLSYLVTQTFRAVANWLGEGGVFAIFLGCDLVFFVFIFSLLPETRGLSLEAIERLFEGEASSAGSAAAAGKAEPSAAAAPARAGPLVRRPGLLVAGFGLLGLGFGGWLLSTLIRYPLFPLQIDCAAEGETCVWNRAWLLTTVLDYYTCALCLCAVIIQTEPRWWVGVAWSLGICCLGAPTACAWCGVQVWRRGSLALAKPE